jgi:parallel beta-helix repeat protein
MQIKAAACVIAAMLLSGCGSSDTSVNTARPTATRPRGTPTRTLRPGESTPTPTATSNRTTAPTRTTGPVEPQTLYVRASGSDDADGTSPDTALQTLVRAAEMIGPGTTIHVGPGVYFGRIAIDNVPGTAGNPIELLADPSGDRTDDPPGPVTIDADGTNAAIVVNGSPFVTIDGFIIRGAVPGQNAGNTISVRARSDDVTISNCEIIDDGESDGIRIDTSSDALIFNNLVFRGDRGIVILGNSRGTRVINNTIVRNQRTGIVVAERGGRTPVDTTVLNNIIQDNDNNLAINVDEGSGEGYDGDANLAFEPDVEDQATIYRPARIRGQDDVNEDALFVGIEAGDVRLESDSPAIDAGTPMIGDTLRDELRERSATADGERDTGTVDMGYHYPL